LPRIEERERVLATLDGHHSLVAQILCELGTDHTSVVDHENAGRTDPCSTPCLLRCVAHALSVAVGRTRASSSTVQRPHAGKHQIDHLGTEVVRRQLFATNEAPGDGCDHDLDEKKG